MPPLFQPHSFIWNSASLPERTGRSSVSYTPQKDSVILPGPVKVALGEDYIDGMVQSGCRAQENLALDVQEVAKHCGDRVLKMGL